ncbi:hypothetical protein I4U23_006721 [Adineta vaga]|nr:hypothetical protein I4U23_006721 [Adineta vaga]
MDNILILNLLGKRFPIPSRLVLQYPQTLLGNQQLLSKHYRHERNDYYFERNPLLFPYIFTYYTLDKKIFCPHHIPLELLKHECDFFQLTHSKIYREINRIETYHYFSRNLQSNKHFFIDIVSLLTGLSFLITTSMERLDNSSSYSSWPFIYFLELFSTLFLTSTVAYQMIFSQDICRRKSFLIDFFCSILSIILITLRNFIIITTHHWIYILILVFKILRLMIVIVHLRLLRLIIRTFIQRFETIFILVFLNIILVGSFSELAFAFERRQLEDQTNHATMKTHFDAFWWATSLSFTIGFGHTDAHSTLTTIGRFCSYMLTFFGLLFNGLILQELIKGFLKLYREDRRDQ